MSDAAPPPQTPDRGATLRAWCVSIETASTVHVTVEASSEREALELARADLGGPWEFAVEDPPDVDWPTAVVARAGPS